MTAQIPRRRTKSGRELAEEFGISRSTVTKMIAEPRDRYEQRAKQRRARAVDLRLQGFSYREIAVSTGDSIGTVGRRLADARSHGEWALAVARRAARCTE
ncbi:replication protein RepB [Chitinophaga sp. Cy-1792]|nr:replication protein RepB [Chitinophaga sp. Cy-1792]